MAAIPASRTPRLLAALLVAALFLTPPAIAMDVQIEQVDTNIRTTDGGGSFLGPLVKAVTDALEEQAARKRRQNAERRPQQPA